MLQTNNSFAKIGDAVPRVEVRKTITLNEALEKIAFLRQIL